MQLPEAKQYTDQEYLDILKQLFKEMSDLSVVLERITSPEHYTNVSMQQSLFRLVEALGWGNNAIGLVTINIQQKPPVITSTKKKTAN